MTLVVCADTLHQVSEEPGRLQIISAALQDAAQKLAERAEWSSAHRSSEADLRSDLFTVLQPYAENVARVPPEDIRQEGTGKSGRFDSMFGRAIFEYKRPGLLDSEAERREAAKQGIGYLEDSTLGAQVVIITDGNTWAVLRDPDAGAEPGEQTWLFTDSVGSLADAEQRFAWHANGIGTARRVLALLDTLKSAPVSPLSVTARLGIQRPEVMLLLRILADRLANRTPNERTDVLFKQWIQLAGVAYGIAEQSSPFPNSAEVMLGAQLSESISRAGFGGSIFVLHTYVSLASKFLATELLALIQDNPSLQPTEWVVLPRRDFARQLRALEQGIVADRLSARAMFASDLFGWWATLVETDPELDDAIRGIVHALAELA